MLSARPVPAEHARMLEVLAQFRVVFKSVRRHYRDVELRSHITGALLWALAEVAGRPGAQVGELARALAVHQSTASNLVRRLAARGLSSASAAGATNVRCSSSPRGRACAYSKARRGH